MRELSKNDVQQVSGAGLIADIGGVIGSGIASVVVPIPGISGIVGGIGSSVGQAIGGAIENIIGSIFEKRPPSPPDSGGSSNCCCAGSSKTVAVQ